MREAIVKLSSLGDIIHLALLLPMFGEHARDWFVDEAFSEILNHSPYVSRIHSLPIKRLLRERNFKALYACLKQLNELEEYAHVIDAQGLMKSAAVTYFLPSKRKLGFSYRSAKEGVASCFYHEHCRVSYDTHILTRNAKLLFQAYRKPFEENLLSAYLHNKQGYPKALAASEEAKGIIDDLLGKDDRPKIVFVLESSKPNKIYPKEQFLALSRMLGEDRAIYLLWHSAKEVALEMARANKALFVLPKLSLDSVKALLLKMDLVIGGDTGVVHLAYALDIPSITLFGNTPIERFALLGEKNLALRAEGGADYDKNDFSIQTLSPSKIAKLAEEVLG